MTEAEARIEQLKTQPPRIERTFWEKCERVIGWATAVIAVVALLIGVNNVSALAQQSQHTLALATCINNNLASRQIPQQLQREAQLVWVTAVYAAFTATSVPPATETAILRRATGNYKRALIRANRQAKAKPLGKC